MGRLIRAGAFLWCATLIACGSSEEQPAGEVSPEARQEIELVLGHLNNESATERWRERLVELGSASPAARKLVLDRLGQELETSWKRGGAGAGVLRPAGRRRAVEAAGRLGDDPQGRQLLGKALEDPDVEVKAAAGAGLAGWSDPSCAPALVGVVVATKEGQPARATALQGLRRLASAQHRDPLLLALRGEVREALEPVLLTAFPEADGERRAALRGVAATHKNPHARAFALHWLAQNQDPETPALAQKALEDGDPALRPTALAALGQTGGAAGAEEIERRLLADPKDPAAAARGLFKVGTHEAVERAVNVFKTDSLSAATRAAVAREVLGRLRDKGAPAAYGEEATLDLAREALRGAVDRREEGVFAVAITALGRVGAPGSDVDLLLGLLRTPEGDTAATVVEAIGHLGGAVAAGQLVELLRVDPSLRGGAAKALAGFSEPSQVPVDDVIDLLGDEDLEVRKAAIAALEGLSRGQNIPYDPAAEPGARAASAERWRKWWASRRGN